MLACEDDDRRPVIGDDGMQDADGSNRDEEQNSDWPLILKEDLHTGESCVSVAEYGVEKTEKPL